MTDILSRKSDFSKISQQSQKILDGVSEKSASKIYSLQGQLTEDAVNSVWASFGLYISKQLRSGRSVKIPNFGIFTFTNPDVTLPGVTNPEMRDKQFRQPAFMAHKDFLNGIPIQSGIFTDQGVRAINLHDKCGNIQMIQMNQSEISESANCSKENVRLALERVFRQLSQQAKKDGNAQILIPGVGIFYYKRGIVSINFLDSLKRECKGIVKRPLDEQILKRRRYLTADKLKQLELQDMPQSQKTPKQQTLDSSAVDWLGRNYDFHLNDQPNNQKTKDKHQINSLRSQSISNTNESQIILNGQQPLKKMQNWLLTNNHTPLTIFNDIAVKRAKYPNFISAEEQGDRIKLNKDDFITFFIKIGCTLPIAELEYIFMKIDKISNGFVDYNLFKEEITGRDDSIKVIQRSFKDLWVKFKLNFQKKNLKELLIEPSKKLYKEDLQQYLLVMEPSIKNEEFPQLISILMNGQSYIESSRLATILSNTFDDLHFDLNWIYSIKKKISSQLSFKKDGIPNFLKEFQQHDSKKTGQIDSTSFKQSLKNQKIELNQTDLNRLFKYEQSGGLIEYQNFIKSLEGNTFFVPSFNNRDSEALQGLARSINSYIEQSAQNYTTFLKNLLKKDGAHSDDTAKIRVSLFARLIFKYVYPEIKPHVIETLSNIIDIDKDGYIDKFDLETFITRYKNFNLNSLQKSVSIVGLEQNSPILDGIDLDQLPDSIKNQRNEESANGVHFGDEDDDRGNNSTNKKFNADAFPMSKLTEKQIDELNSQIRRALNDKKLSNYDAFNTLDSNQDGFIILSEMNNLDKIIKLTQQQKDGYFGYMDNHSTGMIDYQRFLEVINKSPNYKNEVKEDNWDWQIEALQKIRKWFKSQNLTHEEAFKIADIDFDGNIGKKDLQSFLVDILHIPHELITETRLDRLFKLIDQHKRDLIQIGDFNKVLDDKFEISQIRNSFMLSLSQNGNSSSTGMQTSDSKLPKIRYPSTIQQGNNRYQGSDEVISQTGRKGMNSNIKSSYSSSLLSSKMNHTSNEFNSAFSSHNGSDNNIFEWKKNAKHQIGLFVSKFYPDTRTSFEKVSGHQNRLLYSKFRQWIDENRVLKGFNLTEKLLQQLFSDFDPHKKGYLSEHDWVSQLKQYDSTEQIIKEIVEAVEIQFKDCKEAFNAFSEQNKDINFKQFCIQIYAQQPKRFKEEDLIKAWNRLAGSIGHTLNLNDFKEQFYPNHSSSTSKNIIQSLQGVSPYASLQQKSTFNSTLSLISYANTQNTTLNVIDKMKKIVRSSEKKLEDLFAEYDPQNSGFVTNLEFRNVIKKLNIGLSIYDIDSVLNVCESVNGGTINWKEFCFKIKQTDSDIRLVNRAKQRLEKIRKDIYLFLLSPKDAFRQYNENRSGKLTFDEFKTLIIQLGKLSQSEMPSLTIIKDIFDFIDIRKDGVIDIHEWMETFRKIEGEQQSSLQNSSISKRKISQQIQSLQIPKVINLSSGNQLGGAGISTFDSMLFGWECSQQFDLVLAVIGKNRKVILDKFKIEHKQISNITYEKAKNIIGSILEQSNIRLSEKNFSCLIKFAEKNGIIDYRFMMEVFKQRQQQIQQYPIK